MVGSSVSSFPLYNLVSVIMVVKRVVDYCPASVLYSIGFGCAFHYCGEIGCSKLLKGIHSSLTRLGWVDAKYDLISGIHSPRWLYFHCKNGFQMHDVRSSHVIHLDTEWGTLDFLYETCGDGRLEVSSGSPILVCTTLEGVKSYDQIEMQLIPPDYIRKLTSPT